MHFDDKGNQIGTTTKVYNWFGDNYHAYNKNWSASHEKRRDSTNTSSSNYSSHGTSSYSSGGDFVGIVCCTILVIAIGLGILYFSGNQKQDETNRYLNDRKAISNTIETLYVHTKQMKLRSGPGGNNSEIGRVNFGDNVTVYSYANSEDGGKWVKVRVGNSDGWLNRKYLIDTMCEADKRYAIANRIELNQKSNSTEAIISTDTFILTGKVIEASKPQGSGGFWYFTVFQIDDNEKYGFGCSSQSELYFRVQNKDVSTSDGFKAMKSGVNVVLYFKNKDLSFFQRCSRGAKCDGSICPIGIVIN